MNQSEKEQIHRNLKTIMDMPKRVERLPQLVELGKKVGISLEHGYSMTGYEDKLIERIERRLSAIQPEQSKNWWQDPYKRLTILFVVLTIVLSIYFEYFRNIP